MCSIYFPPPEKFYKATLLNHRAIRCAHSVRCGALPICIPHTLPLHVYAVLSTPSVFNLLNLKSPFFNFPPVHTIVGAALAPQITPSTSVNVLQPAASLTNPPSSGPTRLPAANAILNNPYAWANAPNFPNLPGRSSSNSNT